MDDVSQSSSSNSWEESSDTLAAMGENEEDSFNEGDYEPEKVADIQAPRKHLVTLQPELKMAIEKAKQGDNNTRRQGARNRSEEEDIETPV